MLVFLALIVISFVRLHRGRSRCRGRRGDNSDDASPLALERRSGRRQLEQLFLAFQAGLLIYAFGGIFLSLEVFELPWVMIIVAGAAPVIVERLLDDSADAVQPATKSDGFAPRSERAQPPFPPAPAIPYLQRLAAKT